MKTCAMHYSLIIVRTICSLYPFWISNLVAELEILVWCAHLSNLYNNSWNEKCSSHPRTGVYAQEVLELSITKYVLLKAKR